MYTHIDQRGIVYRYLLRGNKQTTTLLGAEDTAGHMIHTHTRRIPTVPRVDTCGCLGVVDTKLSDHDGRTCGKINSI